MYLLTADGETAFNCFHAALFLFILLTSGTPFLHLHHTSSSHSINFLSSSKNCLPEYRTNQLCIPLKRISNQTLAKKLVGSTTTSPAPKPPSPPKVVQVQAEGKRRKRKLFKTDISAPFECSPFEVQYFSFLFP